MLKIVMEGLHQFAFHYSNFN